MLFSRVEFLGGEAPQAQERSCKKRQPVRWTARRTCESTGIGWCAAGQAEPKHINELRSGAEGVRTGAQITQAVQPLDGQCQAGEQSDDHKLFGW